MGEQTDQSKRGCKIVLPAQLSWDFNFREHHYISVTEQ